MADYPFLPLWTDAYLADTTHLTTEEHGAYLLLLMAMWRTKRCRIPDDDDLLARITRLGKRRWRRVRSVIEPFFTIQDGTWTQGRLLQERIAVERRSETQRAKARARWLRVRDGDPQKFCDGRQQSFAIDGSETADQSEGTNSLKRPNVGNAAASARHVPRECNPYPDSESTPPSPLTSFGDLPPAGGDHASAPGGAPAAPQGGGEELRKPKRKSDPARGSRLPPDWQPSEDDLRFAAGLGLTPPEIRIETEKFRDYWAAQTGQRARKCDWRATWRNWCRKAADDLRRNRAPPGQPGSVLEAYRMASVLNPETEDDDPVEHGPLQALPH